MPNFLVHHLFRYSL